LEKQRDNTRKWGQPGNGERRPLKQFLRTISRSNMKHDHSVSVKIRKATSRDAQAIARVLRESFAEYEAAYTAEGFSATTPTQEQVRIRLDEGPIWVAVQRGKIVGTVSAVSRGEGLYIRGMAVHGVARGRGVGKLLLREVENFARAHQHSYLVLSTTPFLIRAIRLYEQAGFHRSGEGPHDLSGTPLFTMLKTLDISTGKMLKGEK
jgi:ribosomal protein S18 acetylase RimI-like enzyme